MNDVDKGRSEGIVLVLSRTRTACSEVLGIPTGGGDVRGGEDSDVVIGVTGGDKPRMIDPLLELFPGEFEPISMPGTFNSEDREGVAPF